MDHYDYSKPENLHVRDCFITQFKYPEGEFYEEEHATNYFDVLKLVLSRLTEDELKIVFVKILNKNGSFRNLAKLIGMSHEQFRKLWLSIRDKYPIIYQNLQNVKAKNYNGNKNYIKREYKKSNNNKNQIEFKF